jgi:hypothetical protein
MRKTCQTCRYAIKTEEVLICHRNPPSVAVVDNKPLTMRVAVHAGDQACGEHQKRVGK